MRPQWTGNRRTFVHARRHSKRLLIAYVRACSKETVDGACIGSGGGSVKMAFACSNRGFDCPHNMKQVTRIPEASAMLEIVGGAR
jgi:hypothetical protein